MQSMAQPHSAYYFYSLNILLNVQFLMLFPKIH